ncbi:MAG: GEVED domain-containing protein [Bacteroidales bacterium]
MNVRSTILIIMLCFFGMAQVKAQSRSGVSQPDTQKEKLIKLAEEFNRKHLIQRAEIERVAKEKGWVIRHETSNSLSEIQFIDRFGFPQSYSTNNLNAGRTTNTDDIWAGGSTGLDLTGAGYIVGEWDGGGVLTTHQEFNNGGGTRVTQMDVPAATHYHSTHVAGTIVGEGQVAAAHGMATGALLHAYEWTDDNTEMATAAAGGLTISNHSYGWTRGWAYDAPNWYWYGNPTISATEDYLFGFYDSSSQEWDDIAYNAPNYLIVKSAGNDRNDDHTGNHYYYNGTNWVLSNTARDPDGGADGYDCIDQKGVAKNLLTVGAVNDIPGGYVSPASVVISAFSSYGPTDDGRIKPDIVGNGVGVYSTTNTGIADYTTLDGTSMSSPNVTGTLVLLQDYYKSLRGGTMTAAALKGLAINTANEAGPANGPDYMFGWGLMNASGAANLITTDNTQGGQIVQATLVNGQTTDYTYYSNGSNVNVTLCWTDPAGTPPAASLNPATLMLVNDLNLRVIGATTNLPWILNPASPSSNATKGNNTRDNVECVNMLSPAPGYYTIRIYHSGSLSGGSQPYALIINGMTTTPVDTYCSARSTNFSSFEYISKVVMGTINNTSGRSPGGFGDYSGMVNKIIQGTSETLSVTINGYSGDVGKAWVDWNQDGDFADAGEEFALGTGAGPVYSVSIAAPATALIGYTTMRVRLGLGAPTSCGTLSYGETEDYTINVLSHCEAGGGCDEYISNVTVGSINNSSVCGRYSDYTSLSTNLPVNSTNTVLVTAGTSYSSDQCGVWVDWNDDGDFTDANEAVTVTGTPGNGPYSATIDPPLSTSLGSKVMRVRLTYTGVVDPCGTTTFGEVEDYTINVTAALPNYWVGGFNHYWHQAANWSLGHIPTIDEPVYVNNNGYQPVYVDDYPLIAKEECKSLSIGTGAQLEIQNQELAISNDLTINGQLGLTDPAGVIRSLGNVIWNSGSTANFTANGVFWVYGDWDFNPGATANMTLGYVDFTGPGSNWIRAYSVNSSLPSIGVYKSGADWIKVSNLSSQVLTINNSIYIQPSCNLASMSSMGVILKGNLFNSGNYDFTQLANTGSVNFEGYSQTINHGVGATGVFRNVHFGSVIGTTTSSNITVTGDVYIDQGFFNPGSTTVTVGGNWSNSVGTAGFTEGTSRVVFNGAGHQYVLTNETFNIVEANMGAALRVSNAANTVTCNQYDWTTGGIDVVAGTFTALDLVDNGLYGTFWVNPGGTLNITQDLTQYTDLHGELHIYGGTMNVTGGIGQSYWPYVDNGVVEMTGGVLDFKNNGIFVFSTGATLTETITGGTIRTNGYFTGNRVDFNPAGGTIELYGTNDTQLSHGLGSNFANLLVNKAVVLDNSMPENEVFYDREGHQVHSPLANGVTAVSDLVLTGNLTIQTGTLVAPASIKVGGNWTNNVGTTGFTEGAGTVEFNGATAADVLTSETFYNLDLNKSYASFDALEIWQDIGVTNDLHLVDGSMKLRSPADLTITGNVAIDLNAGLNVSDGYGPSVTVGKNWTNTNVSYASNYGFFPGLYSTVTFNGTTDQILSTSCPQEDFFHLVINKSAGRFSPTDNIQCLGNILIANGVWEDFLSGKTHFVFGNFTVNPTGGFHTASIPNTVEFKGAQHSVLTYSGVTGYFRNLKVNKNPGYTVTQVGSASCQNGGNMTVNQGYYLLNGNYLFVSGNVDVNFAGYLNLSPGSLLVLADAKSLNINAGGRMDILGTLATPATVRSNVSTAHYAFNVKTDGTIAADYGLFKNMGLNGISVEAGGIVDPAHTFYNCSFQDGIAGGTLLTLNNSQVMTIRNAAFPTNTWTGTSNVTKIPNTGHVYFVDFTGGFSGETFDADANNLVDWIATLTASPTATPTAICAGSSSQLNVTRVGGLAPFNYIWSPVTGLSNSTIINPLATPPATTNYSVTVTDALGSTATGSVLLTVNPVLPVSVSITPSANPSPPGNFVTFSAIPVNGGASPTYQWKVNGINAGTGLPTYSYVPSNNDQVTCVVTSNYVCPSGNPATSNVVTMIIVATNTSVTGIIPSPLSICFDASNTVTVAGGGNTFVVQSGASATMIAGVKISYLPGASVLSGGYMHGYITSTNSYCGSLPPAMVAVVEGGIEQEPLPTLETGKFSVFPNPSTGAFTIRRLGEVLPGKIHVDIFDVRGRKISETSYSGERSHEFNMNSVPPGIYFIKILTGEQVDSFKLIIAR